MQGNEDNICTLILVLMLTLTLGESLRQTFP